MLPHVSGSTEVRCAGTRETVPEIGCGDWKGPLADSSEVVRWNDQLVGCG